MRRILEYWRRWRAWDQKQWDDRPGVTMLVVSIIGIAAIVAVAVIAECAGVRL